jgi:hypothetical protein
MSMSGRQLPQQLVYQLVGGLGRERSPADQPALLPSTDIHVLPALGEDHPAFDRDPNPGQDDARNDDWLGQFQDLRELVVFRHNQPTKGQSFCSSRHSRPRSARAPTSAREPAYTIGSGEILSDLPVTFHPRWSTVINSSLVRHTWSRTVRFRTKLPCMPGSRRKHIGRHANCPPLHSAGFLIPIASSQQETKDRSIGRTKGESLTAARRPHPSTLVPPLRALMARGGMRADGCLRALSPCRPDSFRGETVGAVRALRRLGTSFSLGNAQPGAPRDHSAEPSSVSIKGRSDAHRRAIAVSPIAVHSNSSLSFTAKTDQPPSTSRRAASKTIKIISFNRPQDARRRFLNVEKAGVERRG